MNRNRKKLLLFFYFIFANNESSSHACTDIERLPRGLNALLLVARILIYSEYTVQMELEFFHT